VPWGVEVWLYFFFSFEARSGWVVNAMPRPLYLLEWPGTRGYWRLGWPQGRPRQVWKICPSRDSIARTSSPPLNQIYSETWHNVDIYIRFATNMFSCGFNISVNLHFIIYENGHCAVSISAGYCLLGRDNV